MDELKKVLVKHFETLVKEEAVPFETRVDKDKLYELYLDSFRPEDNPMFRERREFDCSSCRQFIRNIGGIVFIKGNEQISIWDVDMTGTIFEPIVKELSNYVKSKKIASIYLNDSKHVGVDHNHELLENGKTITWEHLYFDLPQYMVHKSKTTSIATKKSEFNAIHQVFERSLEEISVDSVETVIDLINQNSLYKGEEWLNALTEFLKYKEEYDSLSERKKSNYTWLKSLTVGPVIGKIRNHSMGRLLVDISNHVELNKAVKSYEKIVAPTNYKRPKPIISAKMIKDAENKIKELGLESALRRRFAVAEDIDVKDIAFVDRTIKDRMINSSVFDELMSESTSSVKPQSFDKVQGVSIDKFMSDILPTLTSLEVLVENRHSKNLVSLIAPVNKDINPLFKWKNNFTWAYSGNIADSDIRENVKSHGGNVDGVMRFSLQWNDGLEHEEDDLDAYCKEILNNGKKYVIYYGNRNSTVTNGHLDIDIQHPKLNKPAVENIYWSTFSDIRSGEYQFFVENFHRRTGTNGFRAELELNGEVYSFDYNKSLRHKEKVDVVTVKYDEKTNQFSVKTHIDNELQSKDIWGITTNQFVPVSLVTLSPNYWGDEKGVGNKHYMFMLKDCVNPDKPYGFYNEYLRPELVEHRKVFEALGEKLKVASNGDQLSGLGFSSTQKNVLIVKAKGKTERTLKIKF